jgi:putative NADPH-quinone reductase
MKILIIDGHPDAKAERFCHALAAAYEKGALSANHDVEVITIAELEVPSLRSKAESDSGVLPNLQLEAAQKSLVAAEHIVIIYPLWLGDVPAYLKAFLEHVLSPHFAFDKNGESRFAHKSARIIVTMGMPAVFYRWYFWSHSLTSLKRNILGYVGIKSIGETLIGSVETVDHTDWLQKVEEMGYLAV